MAGSYLFYYFKIGVSNLINKNMKVSLTGYLVFLIDNSSIC
jgi:hypothetical protein